MANDSVRRFRQQTKRIPEIFLSYMRPTIVREAERLAEEMRKATPVGDTGNLRKSIRVERGPNYEKNGEVFIRAGGDLTTKEVRGGSGVPYDYSRGTEFGTVSEPAEPFFFTTYRRMKNEIQGNITESIPKASKSSLSQELDAFIYKD